MQYLNLISQFVSENQLLLTTALLIAAYFLKRFIDYKAADPAVNIYDTIKPGSDALYSLVHKAIEKRALLSPMSSDTKLLEYMEQVQKFERAWANNRFEAVQQLMAWYLSIKAKDVAANPSTTTTPPLTADGLYLVTLHINFSGPSPVGVRNSFICRVSDNSVIAQGQSGSGSLEEDYHLITRLIPLSAGESICFKAAQQSGFTLAANGTTDNNSQRLTTSVEIVRFR